MNATRDPNGLNAVDQLLADVDADDAAALRPVLAGLHQLGQGGPVEPSPAVSALLQDTGERPVAPMPLAAPVVSLDAARSRRRSAGRRRTLAATLALTGVLGVGTAAAAVADAGFRENLGQGIATIVGTITGNPAPAPAPQRPVSGVPAAPETAPVEPSATTPAQVPTQPAATSAPAGTPSSSATPTHGLSAPTLPSLPIEAPLTPPTLPAQLPTAPAGTLPSPDTGAVPGARVP